MSIAARRVVVYDDADGGWHWKAQGNNWRTVAISDGPLSTRTQATRQARKRFKGAEVVVTERHGGRVDA